MYPYLLGICIVKDPRVKEKDNEIFLDMMEKYFELSDGIRDARPEYHYQVSKTAYDSYYLYV